MKLPKIVKTSISFNRLIFPMNFNHRVNVTGPPGALLFDVKPEITLKESLELLF